MSKKKRISLNDRMNKPITSAITAFTTVDANLDNSKDKRELDVKNNEKKIVKDNVKNDDIKTVTKNNNEIDHTKTVYKNVVNSDAIDETKIVQRNVQNSDKLNDTKTVEENIKNNDKLNNTNFVTKNDTDNDTNNVKENDTKSVKEIVKNKEVVITQTKSIKIGNSSFKSVYRSDDKVKRAAYHLRQDTIDKIQKCSKLSGLKKAEFVDLILNNILTDILNKVDK